jgi:hypothetical protein
MVPLIFRYHEIFHRPLTKNFQIRQVIRMSRVIRLETEEEPERFFDMEEEKKPSGFFERDPIEKSKKNSKIPHRTTLPPLRRSGAPPPPSRADV